MKGNKVFEAVSTSFLTQKVFVEAPSIQKAMGRAAEIFNDQEFPQEVKSITQICEIEYCVK